jgi:guanine deaminase
LPGRHEGASYFSYSLKTSVSEISFFKWSKDMVRLKFAFNLAFGLSLAFSGAAWAEVKAYRASILHFVADPTRAGDKSYEYFQDGSLVIEDGHVKAVGSYTELSQKYRNVEWVDRRGRLIMPGFVDTHIHYPQTEMIAAYGEQLLEWLNTYTFPTERKYASYTYARQQSRFFIDQLLRNGTTTALVFGTVHPESVDALFDEASRFNMRIIGGKVMMDRNAPDYLVDTAESSYTQSKALIEKWHEKKRLLYAVTPRFAPTSTPEQLTAAGKLKAEFPSVYVHTHVSENPNEVEWVKSLFPERTGYFDVYEHYGLAGDRSVFAHGVHLTDSEFDRVAATNSSIAFCPTSNLFLGSGLFKLIPALDKGIRVGMGTDVGAGTSFSMFQTMNEAYKVVQLQGQKLSSLQSFYLATLGGAQSLGLENKIGSFKKGNEADFVVINWEATPLTQLRTSNSKTLQDKLFVLLTLGDDRHIQETYVDGKRVYRAK